MYIKCVRFERNLLFQNLPGNRHKIILSTFRFIENLLQDLLCLQWSNTSIHKKRKQIIRKENYLGNHFSHLVTYYIIFIFNFLKKPGKTRWFCLPITSFSTQGSNQTAPPDWSAGPTSREPQGPESTWVTIHFSPGWVT